MRVPERIRSILTGIAIAGIAVGMLAFGVSDLLYARESYVQLDAAREATNDANWRSYGAPSVPFAPVLDMVGALGVALLLTLVLTRNLPDERRRSIHVALGLILAGMLVGVVRRFIDRSHDHEGAWGALQLGCVGLAFLALAWSTPAARIVTIAGAALLTLRQPLIWRASDAYVAASGDATLAFAAEAARLTAHATGALAALLLGVALLLVAKRTWPLGPSDKPPGQPDAASLPRAS